MAGMAGSLQQTIAGASTSCLSRLAPSSLGKSAFSGRALPCRDGGGLHGRLRPDFSKKLSPLELDRGDKQYLHVRYVFKPSAVNSLEPVTLTVSTPLPSGTPLHSLDEKYNSELVSELGRLYQLPSPGSKDVSAIEVDVKRHPYADLEVGERWQEIHGSNDWEGLMDEKMDPILRGEVIRYGEFAQATYDAFDNDHESKLCGNSKFCRERMLEEVGLKNRGYEISQFLYATADAHVPKFFRKSKHEETWSKDSNFMGFVAVCTSPEEIARLGRRDIVVAWRGTVTKLEWLENVREFLSPIGLDPREKDVMVESGFLSVYKSSNENSRYNKLSAREQVLAAVSALVEKYKDEELSITVTGHSLGSALSMICAYDIAESGINKRQPPVGSDKSQRDQANQDHNKQPLEDPVPVTVFSFAGPRVGNRAFKNRIEELGVKVLRVVNVHDLVPRVPGFVFNEGFETLHKLLQFLPSPYLHVGTELELDSNMSDFLRDTEDVINAHNLEAYLHLVDGYHGANARFSPAVRRDIALVNKASDFLEPKFGIPANWWEDRKMMMDPATGHWVVSDVDTVLERPRREQAHQVRQQKVHHFVHEERKFKVSPLSAKESYAH